MTRNRGEMNITTDDAKPDTGDYSNFKPRKPQAQPTTPQISEAAQQTGFTTRHAAPKVDGRSLRTTKRTAQFNISVAPDTKDRFWALAQAAGAQSGEEFLIRLMDGFVGS